jgi:hypothetical protein
MPPGGFEATIPANARLKAYALDRETTGIGGIEPRILNSVASHCTDYVIPAVQYRLT